MDSNSSRQYISNQQKEHLIELLEKDDNLRNGTFSNEFTHKVARERWEDIAEQLNIIPGACKTGVQWKKTWQDLKQHYKKKYLRPNEYGSVREGATVIGTINNTDAKVLHILGVTEIQDYSNTQDSFVDVAMCEENGDVSQEITLDIIEDDVSTDSQIGTVTTNDHVYSKKKFLFKSNLMNKFPRKKKRLVNSSMIPRSMAQIAQKDLKIKEDHYRRKEAILDNYYKRKLDIETQKNHIEKQLIDLEKQKIQLEKQKFELDKEKFELEKTAFHTE